MYVAADADLTRAVEGAVRACFSSAGQLCISIERLLVHEAVADEFARALRRAVGARMRLGAGLDYDADMGSLVSAASCTVDARTSRTPAPRAPQVLTGGRHRPDIGPLFYEPTVLDGRDRRHGAAATTRRSGRSSRSTASATDDEASPWPTTATTG